MAGTLTNLTSIEGRRVNVSLRNGTRIDNCQLVSIGRAGIDNLWIFTNGEDVFVPREDVVEVWESQEGGFRAA